MLRSDSSHILLGTGDGLGELRVRGLELFRQRKTIHGLVCKVRVTAYAVRDRDFVRHSRIVSGVIVLMDWFMVMVLEYREGIFGVVACKGRLAG